MDSLENWQGVERPERVDIHGQYATLEPLEAGKHGHDLWTAYEGAEENWRYLGQYPFNTESDYLAWLTQSEQSSDPLFFAIVDHQTEKAIGVATFMRMDTANGVIEIGNLNFSPLLQGTRMSTESLFLMIDKAFELGYRRVEWKCDAENQPSRKAAERLGFVYEGLFRQHKVVKGLNRDTAWFAILDHEWPAHKAAIGNWLHPDNFSSEGKQIRRLADYR